jgi:hypothetical protein
VSTAKRPPTDFKLLRAIYDRHRDDYARTEQTRVFVPIDIPKIAAELAVDVNSVFGRLYYHFEPLYGERAERDERGRRQPRKAFFTPVAGAETNCVNFPLLEAVLAGLWQQRRRDLWTLWIAVVSLAIAIGSLVVAIATAVVTGDPGGDPLG